ncbi:HAMP domain-containing protein [Sphingomonas sp. So64.6b]|uniref:sensor histidine kinase n=1 Tax=Sphingomonas sp. So64.6b TaxID=2997354 RepID=UPI0015FF17FA|nr:ATP-binding protein [Sphingomonas sp. So64.6b]QNA86778.1 HAMP domain-containing protein [Sphingomonas sp. So64.6b]
MALLVAIALFIAQAINFAMLLQERRSFLFEQVTGPAITRLVDAVERVESGRGPHLQPDRGRVRLVPASPIAADARRLDDVEQGLRDTLTDAGLKVGRIQAGVKRISADDPRFKDHSSHRMRRMARLGGELTIAVERREGWLVIRAPWPATDMWLFWRLIAQTLVLYGVILLPVLWIGRRISSPLRTLAIAAGNFKPGEVDVPIEERGPQDVRDVISAFNALRLRVTAMLDEKDRMLGAIGHDLRTPLAALRVRIESVEDDTDRNKMADTIEEMNRTLDDILSLARLGRPSEPLTDVDLAALVDAVVEDFRDLDHDVTFAETARLRMHLRPSLMRRAVRNLIENAIKYGERAEVSILGTEREVRIIVADKGPGIPEDRLVDVFDPFTRLETSRNKETGGIGLGLALAGAIVRDAGGDIVLENRPEGGLNAIIVLPR